MQPSVDNLNTAHPVNGNFDAPQDPAQLVAAFEQFGRLSDQLQQSYQELDSRAAELTEQLASAQNERLKQLAEKEQLANHLQTLLNALPAGVLLVDEKGVIKTANPAAELFLEQSLVNKEWQRVYMHAVSRQTEQDLYLNSGRVLSLKKQPLSEVENKSNSNENKQGEIILLDDVTEQRMLESLADRQNRLAAMGQMAAGLAHQLRTPLASAVLYASQLNQFTADNPRENKAVEKIRTCMRYLEKLINDMLMYAKGGEFAEQQFKLNDLLVTFNTRIEHRLKENNIQLNIISQLNDFKLTGSLDALVSVLINLVENAMQACQENCEINLEVYQQADHLILAVHDNGPGLNVEQQSKIFQPFFTQSEGGTGLGLAVAQSIVQAHHGDLLVKSTPEKGASFYICLPLNRGEQFLASGQTTTINPENEKQFNNEQG
ncbi:Flagellar sensor histidine kinase FleS [hydrothermal vent metagenome]|uniref:histidine kinase n=1 Tax=hydrothermal vent metagenome TaxID=652676 RepID=A0A3B0WUS7_9ZZZZ